jgi:hypothetical protein
LNTATRREDIHIDQSVGERIHFYFSKVLVGGGVSAFVDPEEFHDGVECGVEFTRAGLEQVEQGMIEAVNDFGSR